MLLVLVEQVEVFLQAQWETARRRSRGMTRIRTPYGNAAIWLGADQGREDLALLFRVEERRACAAPGLLVALCGRWDALDGKNARLILTPVPSEWLEAEVLSFFTREGFAATLEDRSIELLSEMTPADALSKAAVICFALDPFSRTQPELFSKAREVGRQHQIHEELLGLLDEKEGGSRIGKLLGKGSAQRNTVERDGALISALRRIGSKVLVQFNCDGGRTLRAIAKGYPLERAIGIEPSIQRARRSVTGFELLHGSVVEPPESIPASSTALLLNALPPSGDLRLDRAAEVLFERIGFEWVLCVEARQDLHSWAETAATRFGYRSSPVWRIGSDHAVMLRRMPGSCPRKGVSIRDRSAFHAGTSEASSILNVDPRWLVYLPPEAATLQSDRVDGELEHPKPIFDYYRAEGISKFVVEAKPMGSRAVAVVCLDEAAGKRRFGKHSRGCIYTRKGRAFFDDDSALLKDLADALSLADFWNRFQTDWVCLEGEVRPWMLKAASIIEEHGEELRAGEAMYAHAGRALKEFGAEDYIAPGRRCFENYRVLYERYAKEADEITFAPVHLIAVEGRTFFGRSHLWHMETLGVLARSSGTPFAETLYRFVTLDDPASIQECQKLWRENAAVVIKPLPFVPKGRRGSAQPAFLCRSREHLRLVFGPEYDLPENRLWLSERRALDQRRNNNRRIQKQWALSIEAVERFVAREAIERLEECIRGFLALDQDPHRKGNQ